MRTWFGEGKEGIWASWEVATGSDSEPSLLIWIMAVCVWIMVEYRESVLGEVRIHFIYIYYQSIAVVHSSISFRLDNRDRKQSAFAKLLVYTGAIHYYQEQNKLFCKCTLLSASRERTLPPTR